MNILFICTGNICRSPFAEFACHVLAKEKGLSHLSFSSCGTDVTEGMAADAVGQKISVEVFGVDMASHSARQISGEIVKEASTLVALDSSHLEFLKMHFPHREKDCVLFMDWVKKAGLFTSKEIVDPFKRGEGAFKSSYAKIYKKLSMLFNKGLIG